MNGCQVCGFSLARIHYNGLVCEKCRVFFFRCVKLKMPKPCQFENNCTLTPDAKSCAACRFRRCREIKMDSSKVATYSPIKNTKVGHFSEDFLVYAMNVYHPNIFAKNPVIQPASLNTILLCHRLSLNEGAISPDFTEVDINVPFIEVLFNPTICATRNTACFVFLASSSHISLPKDSTFLLSYCRRVVTFVDFIHSTHHFMQLPAVDMVKLACYNFNVFKAFCLLEHELTKGSEPQRFVSQTKNYCSKDSFKAICSTTDSAFNGLIEKLRPIFEELILDEIEFIALKILSLFITPVEISPVGTRQISMCRDIFTSLLSDYIVYKLPEITRSQHLLRMKKILEIIPLVKEYSELIDQFYTEIVVNDLLRITGQLSYDLHVRKY